MFCSSIFVSFLHESEIQENSEASFVSSTILLTVICLAITSAILAWSFGAFRVPRPHVPLRDQRLVSPSQPQYCLWIARVPITEWFGSPSVDSPFSCSSLIPPLRAGFEIVGPVKPLEGFIEVVVEGWLCYVDARNFRRGLIDTQTEADRGDDHWWSSRLGCPIVNVLALRDLDTRYREECRIRGQRNASIDDGPPLRDEGETLDRYEARASNLKFAMVRKAVTAKEVTNQALATAATAFNGRYTSENEPETEKPVEQRVALILDGAEGRTTKALMELGFHAQCILAPNVVPSVVQILRQDYDIISWAGRVKDFVRSRPSILSNPLDVIYLDFTGTLPQRCGLLLSLFEEAEGRFVGPGTLLALTFSTRRGGNWSGGQVVEDVVKHLPSGWSPAHVCWSLVQLLRKMARTHNLTIESGNGQGLADYSCYENAEAKGKGHYLSLSEMVTSVDKWAMRNSPVGEASPSNRREGLAFQAKTEVGKAREALGNNFGLLGAAWNNVDEGRAPHAVLGVEGRWTTNAVKSMRKIWKKIQALEGKEVLPGQLRDAGDLFTLKQSVLIYPSQMLFLMIHVKRRREQ